MFRISNILTALFCLMLSGWSEYIDAENLIEIYRKAAIADPILQSAGFDHTASREIATQAQSGYLPSVVVSYDKSNTAQEILESENALFQTGSTSFPSSVIALTISQPVYHYANYLRLKQAKSELSLADAELNKVKQQLLLRVAENYLYALAAEDHLDYLKAERSAVERQLVVAQARERANVGRASDRLEAEARLAGVAADYSEAEAGLQDAYEAISEMTGVLPSSLNRLQQEFPLRSAEPLDAAHWVDAALKQNWELEVQRNVVAVTRQEVKRQEAGHHPTIDLELSDTVTDTGGTLFGGGSKVKSRELMLSFKLPLYLGGSVSSRTREAASKYQSAQTELSRISRGVKRKTRKAFSGIGNAIDRVEALQVEVTAQEEILRLKQIGYKAALYTNLSVLDAERDLYSAKRDYSRARYEYLLNSLRLKAVVGILSEDDLVDLNRWLSI